MFDWINAETFAVLSVAALFGGMLFFSSVMAPLVFIKLPTATAGGFIRAVFPWYYLVMGATSLVGLIFILVGSANELILEWTLMSIILFGFVVARQWLMPQINKARDAATAGDSKQSDRFNRLHRVSVVINAMQLLLCTTVLIRLVYAQ